MKKKPDLDDDNKSALDPSKKGRIDIAESESERMLIDAKRLRNDAEALRERAEAALKRSRHTHG